MNGLVEPQSWEMAHRARFLPGNPDELEVEKYAQDGSLITTNPWSVELSWARSQLEILEAPGRPALCPHLHVSYVWNAGGDYENEFTRLMMDHALRDEDGEVVYWPAWPTCFALDPITNPYRTMFRFIVDYWGADFEANPFSLGPVGMYFDSFADIHSPIWGQMGVTGQDFLDARAAFRAGRSWLCRRLRKKYNDIVIIGNWGPNTNDSLLDMLNVTNGICVEGPLNFDRERILTRAFVESGPRATQCYSTAWNDDPPWGQIRFPAVRAGSHWMERHG